MEKVIFNLSVLSPAERLEDAIANVEYNASKFYLAEIKKSYAAGVMTYDQFILAMQEYDDLRCRVLEEIDLKYRYGISFYEVYRFDYRMESLISTINQMSENKEVYIMFYYVTEREKQEKIDICTKTFPKCKCIPIPYYNASYERYVRRERTSYIDFLKETLGVDNFHEFTYIDNKFNQSQIDFLELQGKALIADYDERFGYYLRSPRIFATDYDDTLYPTQPRMERELEKINYYATEKYLRQLTQEKRESEDFQEALKAHRDIKNRVLEEYTGYKGLIDYYYVYGGEFYSGTIHNLGALLTTGYYDAIIVLTHYNSEEEVRIKWNILKKAVNEELEKYGLLDRAVPLVLKKVKFYSQPYMPGIDRSITSKCQEFENAYGIPFSTVQFIENSESVIKDCQTRCGVRPIQFVEGITVDVEKNQVGSLNPAYIDLLRIFNYPRPIALLDATLDGRGAYVKK